MTRRDFLKGAAAFVLSCGLGFGLYKDANESAGSDMAGSRTVGPLLKRGLTISPNGSGASVSFSGLDCFTVNAAGAELLRLADGRSSLNEIARKAGLEAQMEDVAQFYLTLGNAGYLENRFEVNLIAVEM